MDLNYYNTFITVSPDTKAKASAAPIPKGDKKTKAVIQYELLSDHPYEYTQEEILFETEYRHKGLTENEIASRRSELWDSFFQKSHACLRTSPLCKTYGFGIHFDKAGKAALYPMESDEYAAFAAGERGDVKVVSAMRSKRA